MITQRASMACLLLLVSVAACQTAARIPAVTQSPGGTTAVVPSDLREVYADKTWQWKYGAAFFATNGEFRAWLNTNNNPAFAVGSWWVTDGGELCYSGFWRSKSQGSDHITCFAHRKHGEIWYQRKEPSGSWYVFRSHPAQRTDEIVWIKSGDLLETQFQAIRRQVGAPAS
jgi:hypothetical protein